MINYTNRGFIDRNRVYWMNTRGITSQRIIINEDLLRLPKELTYKDEVDFDIERSNRPLAIGVMSYNGEEGKKYYSYKNDIDGEVELKKEFDSFRYALFDARLLYTYACQNDDIYTAYQKYEMNPKVLKK